MSREVERLLDAARAMPPPSIQHSESERLFAQARRFDPVGDNTLANAQRRLNTREPRRIDSTMWVAIGVVATAAMLLVWHRPTNDSLDVFVQPPARRAAVDVPRTIIAPSTPGPATPVRAPKTRVAKRTDATVIEPAPEAFAPTPTPPPIPELAPQGHRGALKAPDRRQKIAAYRPRAIRELLDTNSARLEQRALSAEIRRILQSTDRRTMLAKLDGLQIEEDADLLTLRGALRAASDRCVDALADFDRAVAIDPASPAAVDARDGRRYCEPR